MREQKGKPVAEAEPTLTWVNWLKDDVPTVGVRTADSSTGSRLAGANLVRGQATSVPRPSVTGVPNRSLGLKLNAFRNDGKMPSRAAVRVHGAAKSGRMHRVSKQHDRAITISLSLPKFTFPEVHVPWVRASKWALAVVVLATVFVGTPRLLQFRAQKAMQAATGRKTETPAYAPLKPATEAGSVAGAGYDGKRQMYKYDDVHNGVTMTISQQPLPDSLRANPKEIQKIAESIGAKEKVVTTNGDAYISTDDKTATQRVVVAHRQLLVFIQSSKSMTNAEWVSYIQQLQ